MSEIIRGVGQFEEFSQQEAIEGEADFESKETTEAKKYIRTTLVKSLESDPSSVTKLESVLKTPAPDLANAFGDYMYHVIDNGGYGMTLLDALARAFIESKQDFDRLEPVLDRIVTFVRKPN